MMRQIPRDMAPTTMARAEFFSSTISFHNWYGVIRSMTKNETPKMITPRNAKTTALITKLILTMDSRSYASFVGVSRVNAAIDARVVTNRLRYVVYLVIRHEACAGIGFIRKGTKQKGRKHDKGTNHSSSSPLLALMSLDIG